MMREYLLQQYPNTYSLPGETEIKQQINAFVQNEKLQKSNQTRRETSQERWVQLLEDVVNNNKVGTPENLYDTLVQKINENDGEFITLPDKATVKRKISSLKTKYKNLAYQSIL